VLEVGSALQVPYFRISTHLDPQVGSTRNLGVRQIYSKVDSERSPHSQQETPKRRSQQAMVAHLRGKKVQTHHDDEIRYIFTLTKYNYNNNLKKKIFGQALERKKKPG
jgi:hypothetical protein